MTDMKGNPENQIKEHFTIYRPADPQQRLDHAVPHIKRNKKQALKNLRRESLFQLVPIKNDGDSLLTFCDIHNKNQGALALIQKELLNNTKELLKESFYIFPVSLYDLMIVPVSLADTVEEMKRQLLESNDELPEEYILSNNIYYYGEKDQLEIIK